MTRTIPNAITAPLANCRHRIPHKVRSDPDSEERKFRRKLRIPIIPQTEINFSFVIVNREVARMRDQIEYPVRDNRESDDKAQTCCRGSRVGCKQSSTAAPQKIDQIMAMARLGECRWKYESSMLPAVKPLITRSF